MGDLGTRIDALSDTVEELYQEEVTDLKDTWSSLNLKWDSIVNKGSDSWEDTQEEFEESFNEIRDNYEELKRRVDL